MPGKLVPFAVAIKFRECRAISALLAGEAPDGSACETTIVRLGFDIPFVTQSTHDAEFIGHVPNELAESGVILFVVIANVEFCPLCRVKWGRLKLYVEVVSVSDVVQADQPLQRPRALAEPQLVRILAIIRVDDEWVKALRGGDRVLAILRIRAIDCLGGRLGPVPPMDIAYEGDIHQCG